jgi:hypothetical protein
MMVLKAVVFCLVLTLSSLPALAAQAAAQHPDAKEIENYRLTEPVWKQVMVATRALMAAIPSDPRFQRIAKLNAEKKAIESKESPTDAEMERAEKIEEEIDSIQNSVNIMSGNKSLDEIEAMAKKEPILANALKSAGLAPREYAKFMAVFIGSMMAHGFAKAMGAKELPKGVSAENIKFIEDHQKEFEVFMKEMAAMSKKEP